MAARNRTRSRRPATLASPTRTAIDAASSAARAAPALGAAGVHDDVVVAGLETVQHRQGGGRRDVDHVLHRLLRRQDGQPVGGGDHGAFHEHVIHPVGGLHRLAQRRLGPQVEGQSHRAVLQVEVDQRRAPARPVGQPAAEMHRHRGRAHAAARADHRHQLAQTARRLVRRGAGTGGAQRPLQQVAGQRLEQIVGDSDPAQVAVEADVVAVADRDDPHRRVANPGQRLHGGQRLGDAGQIDQQQVGRALASEIADGAADVAGPHLAGQQGWRRAVQEGGAGRVGDVGEQAGTDAAGGVGQRRCVAEKGGEQAHCSSWLPFRAGDSTKALVPLPFTKGFTWSVR
ncbi:hypothetical protein [Azospirillum baldaniorum]|uniref:hypothetical protein n=1 Tax=Azospirillum baldaniorum TaxID=1064539 RepID=UPI0009E494E0|nr:hypothetical protein [Azospirillum baldaniorum]